MTFEVLLAASDPVILRELIGQFPRGDWKPMAARSRAQVEAVIESRPLQVVVVHQSLDDISGLDFCRWIKEKRPETLCALLMEDIPRGSSNPAYDISLRHPSPPGVLSDLIISALHRRLAQASAGAFHQEVLQRLAATRTQNYYEVLGVEANVNQIELRRAYDAISLRLHPDRHIHLQGTAAYRDLFELYKLVGEAYRILNDHEKKAVYEKHIERGELRYDNTVREKIGPKTLEDLSESKQAKRFLKLAHQAMTSGRTRSALQNLKFALSMDKENQAIADKISEMGS